MKEIGGLMVLFGAGSFVLGLFGFEFSLLMWIDTWGVAVGNMIRAALVVAGGAMWLMAVKAESGHPQESDAA